MTTPLYDLETRADLRDVRKRSDVFAEALSKLPPFDDVTPDDDAEVKVRKVAVNV